MKQTAVFLSVAVFLVASAAPVRAIGPDESEVVHGQYGSRFHGLGFGAGHFWWTTPHAVADNGKVVVGIGGRSVDGYLEAWRWVAGRGTEGLGDLPGWDGGSDAAFESAAHDVSGNGRVVVGTGQSDYGDEAWRWTQREGLVPLGFIGGEYPPSRAMGVSRDGLVIVGTSRSPEGTQAFRWTPLRGMVGLGTLGGTIFESHAYDVSACGTVVVGQSHGPNGWEAFRWTRRTGMVGLGQLDGSTTSLGRAVSADGRTVVGYVRRSAPIVYEAFRWTAEGGMEGLGDLPGGNTISQADGVSGDGSIVVGASEDSNPYGMGDAFIWDRENGMRKLQTVLEDEYGLDVSLWDLRRAYAITPDGRTIVGDGTNPAGENEAWLVHLPQRPPRPRLPW
jgi:probable HAF family extracellular repeat protein